MLEPADDRLTLTRRAALGVLATGAAVGLIGCTPGEDGPEREPGRSATERTGTLDPDVTLAGLTMVATETVLAALARTGRRHRRLRAVLAPVVAAHEEHARMLAEAVPDRATLPQPTPSTAVTPGPVPRARRKALQAVASLEGELSTTVKRYAFNAESGQLARLLASIAASAAQYGATLSNDERSTGRRGRDR